VRPAFLFFAAIAMLVISCRCSLGSVDQAQEIRIVSYNVHNLFDAEESGNEYPEFKPSKGKWTKELYAKRLANVVEAVRSLGKGKDSGSAQARDPDILCVQEIENEKVLADLAEHFRKGAYRYWAISGPKDSIIHTGVLSRFPVTAMHTHSVMDAWGFGPLRDILEVELDTSGATSDADRILLLICHWKSKREGEQETESARRAAAALLTQRIRKIESERPDLPIIVCGDFNESPDEYLRISRRYPTALMPFESGSPPPAAEGEPLWVSQSFLQPAGSLSDDASRVALYSPWAEKPDGFSIAYRDKREQFDGFLLNAALQDGIGLEYEGFCTSESPVLFDASGKPFEWNGTSGYSDHLPVCLVLQKNAGQARAPH
jgi:endonuclease/exonuclease/phosphatase family metal-dependent hydrolase